MRKITEFFSNENASKTQSDNIDTMQYNMKFYCPVVRLKKNQIESART